MHIQTVCSTECINYLAGIKITEETQKAIIQNIWLTSCLLLHHFSYTDITEWDILLPHTSIISYLLVGHIFLLSLGELDVIIVAICFLFFSFQLQSHMGCISVKVSIYLILIAVNNHYSHYVQIFNSRKLISSIANKFNDAATDSALVT